MVISLWVSRISRHEISHQFASLIATAYHFFLSVSLSLNLVYIYICSDVGYPISWNFSRCLQRFPSWTLFSFTSDNSMSRFDRSKTRQAWNRNFKPHQESSSAYFNRKITFFSSSLLSHSSLLIKMSLMLI